MNNVTESNDAKYIWDEVVKIHESNSEKDLAALELFIKEKLEADPAAKNEIYEKTLEWVNEIRTNEMTDQAPLESLLPGNKMHPDSCVIAKSLDTKYITSVGDTMLKDMLYYNDIDNEEFPKSHGLTWYAEWINKENHDDWGYAELPWFAYLLAKGFDYGAFPELSNASA